VVNGNSEDHASYTVGACVSEHQATGPAIYSRLMTPHPRRESPPPHRSPGVRSTDGDGVIIRPGGIRHVISDSDPPLTRPGSSTVRHGRRQETTPREVDSRI
jgi:hypothetical protein